jgi:hypothetical protein
VRIKNEKLHTDRADQADLADRSSWRERLSAATTKALRLGRHRRALLPHGAIRIIRSIRQIRMNLLFLMPASARCTIRTPWLQ